MDQPSFLTANYLDILYLHRNKQYGGYELRKHYHQRAIKAVLLVVSLAAMLSLFAFSKEKSVTATAIRTDTLLLADITPYIPPPAPPEKVNTPPPNDAATAKFTALKIAPDHQVLPDDQPVENADLKDKQIGTENKDGDVTNSDMAATKSDKKSGSGNTNNIISTPPPAPLKWVEKMPAFKGDLNTWLRTHLKYPLMAHENGVGGKVIISFIVDERGNITQATILKGIGSGCDEEALRVVNSMPPWNAGAQNDRPVKVSMILPIIFELQ